MEIMANIALRMQQLQKKNLKLKNFNLKLTKIVQL